MSALRSCVQLSALERRARVRRAVVPYKRDHRSAAQRADARHGPPRTCVTVRTVAQNRSATTNCVKLASWCHEMSF